MSQELCAAFSQTLSSPGPVAYESTAPPLSYLATVGIAESDALRLCKESVSDQWATYLPTQSIFATMITSTDTIDCYIVFLIQLGKVLICHNENAVIAIRDIALELGL